MKPLRFGILLRSSTFRCLERSNVMHVLNAISRFMMRFINMCLLLAFLYGVSGKALDDLPGWSIDAEGGCHWIGDNATAGVTTVGTTEYPDGGMNRGDSLAGNRVFNKFRCGVIDPDKGYAWFGTYTNPGIVVKVALGDGNEPPRQVGYVILNYGEGFLISAVIDKTNGFAYFGTQVSPTYVVKVNLGEGDNPPSRVGAAALLSDEWSPFCAVIDAPHGYAYFGTDRNPAKVVKIALGEGFESPYRVSGITLRSGEAYLWCGVIDRGNGYAYFGMNSSPARVIKIALGEGPDPPERIGFVQLSSADDEDYLRCGVINPLAGYALFGTNNAPGRIVKIALGEGSSLPSRLGSIALQITENYLTSAAMDVGNGFAYFGTDMPGVNKVIKIDPGEGSQLPVRIGSTALQDQDKYLLSGVIDDGQGYLYFGTYTSPASLVKVATGNGSDLPERVGSLVFNTSDRNAQCAVFDERTGYAYIGTGTTPGKVLKYKLSDGTTKMTRVGELVLENGENYLTCAVIDPDHGFAYFGTGTVPGRVVKVALGHEMEPPAWAGEVILPEGVDYLSSAVIAPDAGYAYFGTNTGPGWVVEVCLGEGAIPPVCTHSLLLDQDEGYLRCAVINPSLGYAWFGTYSNPAYVVKMALGYGNPPVKMSATQLPSGCNLIQNAVIDPVSNYGYFTLSGYPNRLVKIALGWGWTPPEYVAEMNLQSNYQPCPSEIDFENGFAYIGSRGSKKLEKVFLGVDDDPPELIGTLELTSLEDMLTCSVFDKEKGNLYFGMYTDPLFLTRIAPSHKNYIKGTSLYMAESGNVTGVSMYSHAASGHLRLALYNHGVTPALLWQSPIVENTMAGGWLNVAIGEGTPSQLFLESGDYWLVWQTDSMANVPSYSQGTDYKGIKASLAWGEFPAAIGMGTTVSPILTDDQWSTFISYEPKECFETGCTISMPSHDFEEGDRCYCSIELCNAESATFMNIPLFVVLDVYGSYYFAPSFTDMDWYRVTVARGKMGISILPCFDWPAGAGTAKGITWLAAMTNSQMTELIGEMGTFTFGWH